MYKFIATIIIFLTIIIVKLRPEFAYMKIKKKVPLFKMYSIRGHLSISRGYPGFRGPRVQKYSVYSSFSDLRTARVDCYTGTALF